MIVVIFEVEPNSGQHDTYLAIAADLRPFLDEIDGFISVERFQSLTNPDRILSLSFWRDEEAVAEWRRLDKHREAQAVGRAEIFQGYRIRVAEVVRDYGPKMRAEVPEDSLIAHDYVLKRSG